MTAIILIKECIKHGISLKVKGDNVIYRGPHKVVKKFLPDLKRYKNEIRLELLECSKKTPTGQNHQLNAIRRYAGANPVVDQSTQTLHHSLRQACKGLNITAEELWRYLTPNDIEAIATNPMNEWRALEYCARIWDRSPPPKSGHNLPFPKL